MPPQANVFLYGAEKESAPNFRNLLNDYALGEVPVLTPGTLYLSPAYRPIADIPIELHAFSGTANQTRDALTCERDAGDIATYVSLAQDALQAAPHLAVQGRLVTFVSPTILTLLDEWYEYRPGDDTSIAQRVLIPVRSVDRQWAFAWAYTTVVRPTRDFTLVPSGKWEGLVR